MSAQLRTGAARLLRRAAADAPRRVRRGGGGSRGGARGGSRARFRVDCRHPVEPHDPFDQATQSSVWDAAEDAAPRVLVFWDGGFTSRRLSQGAPLVVGRAMDCDVHVLHPSLSRRHLAVHAGPPVCVEDLASANGTRVSGLRAPPRTPVVLEPGVVVEAGPVMLMVQAARSAREPPMTKTVPPGASSTAMKRLDRLTALVATSGLSVILFGETGVGKEVVAGRLHGGSPRASGPFVRLNCAALPEPLLESELFGHERGAFTGAVKSKPGLLEIASGGSVFLDEVADLPVPTQAKLLRVLESREVLRVGGLQPRPIDVRFIAAANRDLRQLVAEGTFRRDLYYRLNGITLSIPPLRERLDEVPKLAQEFVLAAAKRAGIAAPALSRGALEALEAHPWAGNVRELRNAIERALVLSEGGTIAPEHLGLEGEGLSAPAAPADAITGGLRGDVQAYERARIVEALESSGGNQSRAAERLGVSRRTLVSRLSAFGMTKARDRRGADKA